MLKGDRKVVEKANIDGAVNVDAPEELAGAIAESFGLELVPIADIDKWGTTSFTSHPLVLGLLPSTVDGSNGYVISSADSPLWQAAAAGDLTAEHEKALNPGLLSVLRARFDHEVGEAQLWDHTLLGCTTVSLGENWASPAPSDSPTVIWLTRDDALADCVEFWNLRALRPLRYGSLPMYLLPEDISHWTTWPRTLLGGLRRPARFTPDVVLASTTVGREGMDAFAQRMGLERSAEEEPRRFSSLTGAPMRSAPFTYLTGVPVGCFMFDRTYGEVEEVDVPVVRETTTLRFLSPVPLKPATAGLALVRITSEPFNALPKLDCVAKLVSANAVWRDDAIQLSEFLRPEFRLGVRIPTLAAACDAVLAERTRSHAISQKGSIGIGLLDESATNALGEPSVFEAIRQLTTARGEEIAKKLQKLFGKDKPLNVEQKEFAAQFGGRSVQEYRSADRLGHGSAQGASTALERLVGIGWAERGLETACTNCGLKRFVPFSSQVARGAGRCPVCGMTAEYTHTDHGPTVHYRLDGRVDHANDQGVIAHLMVIGALSRRYTHVWLMPGVDLVFHDGVEREADLFGVCDGLVVSGEVKMSGDRFDDDQVNKDIDTSARLGSDVHVMAATTSIPTGAKNLAESLCNEKGIDLRILERDDLRR